MGQGETVKIRIDEYEKYPFYYCLNFEDWKEDDASWYIAGVDSDQDAERSCFGGSHEMPEGMYERLTEHFNEFMSVQAWLQGLKRGTSTIDECPLKR